MVMHIRNKWSHWTTPLFCCWSAVSFKPDLVLWMPLSFICLLKLSCRIYIFVYLLFELVHVSNLLRQVLLLVRPQKDVILIFVSWNLYSASSFFFFLLLLSLFFFFFFSFFLFFLLLFFFFFFLLFFLLLLLFFFFFSSLLFFFFFLFLFILLHLPILKECGEYGCSKREFWT